MHAVRKLTHVRNAFVWRKTSFLGLEDVYDLNRESYVV